LQSETADSFTNFEHVRSTFAAIFETGSVTAATTRANVNHGLPLLQEKNQREANRISHHVTQ
jgi:hypothetical protein